jgi:histidinol-phosphate aminotransferase
MFQQLRDQRIFVRYFPGPMTGDYLRITVGTGRQMQSLLRAIKK